MNVIISDFNFIFFLVVQFFLWKVIFSFYKELENEEREKNETPSKLTSINLSGPWKNGTSTFLCYKVLANACVQTDFTVYKFQSFWNFSKLRREKQVKQVRRYDSF